MNRLTAERTRPGRDRIRSLPGRLPGLSPYKTAALLFCGALASLIVAMFAPGNSPPRPLPPSIVRTASAEPPEDPLLPPSGTASTQAGSVAAYEAADSEPVDPFLAELRERARRNPEEALRWLQDGVAGPSRLQGMLEVVAVWASQDSEAALLWLESNAEGLARLETLQAGIRLWSEGDPSTAASWIEGMANDGSKSAAAEALAGTWAERAPGDAAAWVRSLEAGAVRAAAAAALVETWSAKTPEEAARWARNEALATENPELLANAVEQFTAHDPPSALAFVRGLSPGEETSTAARAYVRSSAREFPAETAEWIASLPADDPLFLDSHAADLMETWALTDSVAASAWLETQPSGAVRETATAAFTEAILPFEPGAAAAWSNTLSDPHQRVQSLERSVGAWGTLDPEAAREWIVRSELEPQLRIHLAELLPPGS